MSSATATQKKNPKKLDKDILVRAVRLMFQSRKADDREIMMKRQHKGGFSNADAQRKTRRGRMRPDPQLYVAGGVEGFSFDTF